MCCSERVASNRVGSHDFSPRYIQTPSTPTKESNRFSVCLLFWFNSFAKPFHEGVRGIGQWETNCRRLEGARAWPGGLSAAAWRVDSRVVEKSKHSTRARTWRSRSWTMRLDGVEGRMRTLDWSAPTNGLPRQEKQCDSAFSSSSSSSSSSPSASLTENRNPSLFSRSCNTLLRGTLASCIEESLVRSRNTKSLRFYIDEASRPIKMPISMK